MNRAPGLPSRCQMPDAGRVGPRAGRPLHPERALSAAVRVCIWITVPEKEVHDRLWNPAARILPSGILPYSQREFLQPV